MPEKWDHRDQPKEAKEILGWGRAKHHHKRQTGTFRRWIPTPVQPFPIGNKGERGRVAIPQGLEYVSGTRGASSSSNPGSAGLEPALQRGKQSDSAAEFRSWGAGGGEEQGGSSEEACVTGVS